MKPHTRWEELLLYKLEGARFDAHDGIELRDLGGLFHLRTALLKIAKADYRYRKNRSGVPKGTDDLVDVRIRGFDDGCIQATVYLARPERPAPSQIGLFGSAQPLTDDEEFLESVHRAAKLIEVAIDAIRRDADLPPRMPANTPDLLLAVFPRVRADERLTIRALRSAPADLLEPRPVVAVVEPIVPIVEPTLPDAAQPGDAAAAQTEDEDEDEDEDEESSINYEQMIAARTASAPRARAADGNRPPASSASEVPPAVAPPLVQAQEVPAEAPAVDVKLREVLEQRADEDRRARTEALRQMATRPRVLEGEVTAADVVGRQARLATASAIVRVFMTKEHEATVTEALHRHATVRLRVSGLAIHSASGAVREIEAHQVAIVKPPDPEAPSEQLFERLASTDPARLLQFLAPDALPPHLLTYAAEIAGRELAVELVVPPLLHLLRHKAPVVREGAIHGLAHHADDPRVLKALAEAALRDPSSAVQTVAASVLEAHAR
jgi:hypothetical protein